MPLPLAFFTDSEQPIPFTAGLPPGFEHWLLPDASPYYTFSEQYGYIIFQQISRNGCNAWLSLYHLRKPASFRVTGNVDGLLLHYTTRGKMHYQLYGQERETTVHQMNLVVSTQLNNRVLFKEAGPYVALDVHIPMGELRQFDGSFPVVRHFLEKTASGTAVTLLERDMMAPERIRAIVQDLVERQHAHVAGERYRSQKVGELIIESLYMISRDLESTQGLRAADREKAETVARHLLEHLRQPHPPTLKQLAKIAGTNEKRLEELFKSWHGVTVYDFFQNARMKTIHTMLTESDIPLQELAEAFGYTDYSSFSFAIKKRFGASPRKLRKWNDM